MKTVKQKGKMFVAAVLCLFMALTLMPAQVAAYVGAPQTPGTGIYAESGTDDGVVTGGIYRDGYFTVLISKGAKGFPKAELLPLLSFDGDEATPDPDPSVQELNIVVNRPDWGKGFANSSLSAPQTVTFGNYESSNGRVSDISPAWKSAWIPTRRSAFF